MHREDTDHRSPPIATSAGPELGRRQRRGGRTDHRSGGPITAVLADAEPTTTVITENVR